MKPVKRTILDTAKPLSDTERRAFKEEHQKEWVERVVPRMTRGQQAQMEERLKRKRGGQRKWTPEVEAVLLEQWRQMRLAGLTPKAIRERLAEQYGVSARSIQNRLSKLRNDAG